MGKFKTIFVACVGLGVAAGAGYYLYRKLFSKGDGKEEASLMQNVKEAEQDKNDAKGDDDSETVAKVDSLKVASSKVYNVREDTPVVAKVVVGDFSARVGNMRNGFELFLGPRAVPGPSIDNRQQRLLDTCASNNLVIGGGLFPHRLIHKYTWTSNAGTRPRAQLDHVLINGLWRNSSLDCRTYRGADIGSDHELAVAKLRRKLANAYRPKATRRLDVEKLKDENNFIFRR
ncbi:craniofacial development protein 2-like [Montipora capricornis]|uniref:craniofacial development protein 2-like n=1 Tax=Montipora foliosa TaxID=591990 RepID=UPI0035F13102